MKHKSKLIEFTILLTLSLVLSKGLLGGVILGLIYGVSKYVYTKVKKLPPASIMLSVGLGTLAGLVSFILRLIF